MTSLDKSTPSSTNGFFAFSFLNMSDLAESNATRMHSLAEPFFQVKKLSKAFCTKQKKK
jgi:hypothetical protein